MSNTNEKQSKALAKTPDKQAYDVGFAKPPVETRFKPGKSGNPRGRPKGAKNRRPALNEERLKEIILEEAYRTIKVNDGPKQVTVPMAQAVVRSLAHNAVKGNTRAQRIFAEMITTTEAQNSKKMMELFEGAIEYKQSWNKEIERCRQAGMEPPEPIPHPDHVKIDARRGTVHFIGPMTEEEKQEWDMFVGKRDQLHQEIEQFKAEVADPEMAKYKDQIEDEILHNRKLIKIIDKAIGPADG
jgi:hypothetical protein